MATMVKEKRREKKKSKEKHISRSSVEREQPSISTESEVRTELESQSKIVENIIESSVSTSQESAKRTEESITSDIFTTESQPENNSIANLSSSTEASLVMEVTSMENTKLIKQLKDPSTPTLESLKVTRHERLQTSYVTDTYQNLNWRLERISIPRQNTNLSLEEIQNRLENPMAYLKLDEDAGNKIAEENIEVLEVEENAEVTMPSAPVFEDQEQETSQTVEHQREQIVKEVTLKLKCMPLEEAIRLYGGKEIAELRAMSEREEAIVEAGPVSGPEHPLVDLLSTFRSSLIAVERERTLLAKGFADEEKFRNSVWKVEKKTVTISEDCSCGAQVELRAMYDHAELLKERLPVAKLKLEGLLRDVQESYCHHQHAALLAHCQIEELISETIRSNKPEIREALALVLQALRLSDNAPTALATALQRWAAILSSALVDARDLRQLLYLLHHLFRQTRSVQWAARVVRVTAGDRSSAARAIAVLELLLARTRLEAAVECTEDVDEGWEEMDAHGGGAVSEGALRERDILALMKAFPLRELVARLVLFTHSDIATAREYEWGDPSGGRGVLKACCGARTLLATLRRGVTSHPHYPRLRTELAGLAASALHSLADLHAHTRDSYLKELELPIAAELEAAFTAGADIMGPELHHLPATLLREATAHEYCLTIITGLHDASPKPVECLSLQLPQTSCEARVVAATQAAVDRSADHQLARMVLDFLLQTALKRKPIQCKGSCDLAAREQLPRLLAAHPYLHTIAFHMLADLNQAEPLPPSSVDDLSASSWRPTPGEVRGVLDDWAQRCPTLIQHLLLVLDYTPHSGLSLESQLTIGSWLCAWCSQSPPEWSWLVLRRLRPHRTSWGAPLDAPPPDPEPRDLLSTAYAVLASSWGHCIPLICSEGVSALCQVAAARAADAVHCLAPVMLVMAQSPVSVSLTPRFAELFSCILKSGPTMVQRALGLGPEPGSEMLLRLLLTQVETNQAGIPRSSILSSWLHGLWRAPAGAALLDAALLAARDWGQLDSHANSLLQDPKASEHITNAVRNVASAPLICECVLRNAHGVEARTTLNARVLDVLHLQRTAGDRIHVDNALKQIGANMPADDLVIYRCATALLSAPTHHPSHLMLWRLFFHLYLQRPPASMQESTPPIGSLFFSGLIKSRLLAQLRKKLQDTITYHHNEVETLKQNQTENPKPPPRNKKEKPTPPPDDSIVPMLTITDLTGESSESGSESESSEGEESEKGDSSKSDAEEKRDVAHLLRYHTAAENMCREFLQWLDKGDKVRAMPHHADFARFIPEQALAAAWSSELSRRRPAAVEDQTVAVPAAPTTPHITPQNTPFQRTIARLLQIKDSSTKRCGVCNIKSPLEGVDWRDARAVLTQAETHLAVIDNLQKEWSSEVNKISSLDAALWRHVTSLRVRRPLPPVQKRCPNKCRPITIHIPHQEWCISPGAESGIQDNRRSARALLRRLARPRPHAARSAAALAVVARRVGSMETARRVAEAAWRYAGRMAACPPAHDALTALVDDLAQRWLCNDSKLCAELVTRWSSTDHALQQRLCGPLASPTRLPAPVYCALLRASLPSHNAFSYLTKFDMSRWSETMDPAQRHELLDALATAAQRWGPRPDNEHNVLLELIGVHTCALLTPLELPSYITRCARAAAVCALPPAHWTHVARAAHTHAKLLTFDQLGNLLRELGVIWWEVRAGMHPSKTAYIAAYSTHVAALLHTLQRALVAAAIALSYAPERVSLYAWSALQESWSAWVRPHAAAPLLPPADEDEAYTDMLRHFLTSIQQVMVDCPGIEEHLLQQIFEWTIQTYLGVQKATSQACGVQLSALLVELRALPWNQHQWVRPSCLHSAMQICASKDREMQCWCADSWRSILAESWVYGAPDDQLAPLLASILYLFTGMPLHQQTLEQATRLPWWRLPEAALEEAFERFFAQYHDPARPYHEIPQFRVLLSASELIPCSPRMSVSAMSRNKRGAGVSRWVRAAVAPPLGHHVAGHSETILNVVADVAPYLSGSDEVEELLGRAAVIMCMEPAATDAMPVWQRVVSSWPPHLSGACVTAAGHLTAFEYFACLADAAVRALVSHKEGGGWEEVSRRWQSCPWPAAVPLLARGRLHAAYGAARAHAQSYADMRTALLALLATSINFIENEAIVALWICAACRIARESPTTGDAAECGAAGKAVLVRWAQEGRRSILRVVTLQADTDCPTASHRLLCRLALCILSNSDSTVRAYEAACSAVLGSNTDVTSWGRTPHPKKLPRLAIRLYPNNEKYFKDELNMAPEDS